MAALTHDRPTPRRTGDLREPPVKAGAAIHAGAMVALDATGHAVPAAAVAAHKVLGRAAHSVASQPTDGAERIRVETGLFAYESAGADDAVAATDIGAPAYVVDDQTVAKGHASNSRPVAGTIFDVDDAGVWVRFA